MARKYANNPQNVCQVTFFVLIMERWQGEMQSSQVTKVTNSQSSGIQKKAEGTFTSNTTLSD